MPAQSPPYYQSPLPIADDPDVDAARDIADRAEFEAAVDAIVNASGMTAEDAEQFKANALDFGPSLDLENFARIALEQGRSNLNAETLA